MDTINYLNKFTIHQVLANGDCILSAYDKIYYLKNDSKIHLIASVPFYKPFPSQIKIELLYRVFRKNISHVIYLQDDSYLVFANHFIYTIKKGEIVKTSRIESCRRPLNILTLENNHSIIWGDYNAKRTGEPVNLYRSLDNGISWEIIYSFPANTIRHIHNVIYDRYRDQYYVLTGDENEESGIWVTADFQKMEPLLVGSQRYRAVAIIPTENGIIIPTDSEYERNYIQFYSFESKDLSTTCELNGSAFFAQYIGGRYFVSTVCEPSLVNHYQYADLWMSEDTQNWEKIKSVKKSILTGRIFRYPAIKLPYYSCEYSGRKIHLSMRSTPGAPYSMILDMDKT